MKTVYDPSFRYTPSKDQGPNYLAEKFKKIRAEQKKAAEAKAAQTVKQFPRKQA